MEGSWEKVRQAEDGKKSVGKGVESLLDWENSMSKGGNSTWHSESDKWVPKGRIYGNKGTCQELKLERLSGSKCFTWLAGVGVRK